MCTALWDSPAAREPRSALPGLAVQPGKGQRPLVCQDVEHTEMPKGPRAVSRESSREATPGGRETRIARGCAMQVCGWAGSCHAPAGQAQAAPALRKAQPADRGSRDAATTGQALGLIWHHRFRP